MRDRSTRTAVVFTVLALGFAVIYWIVVVLSRNGTLPFSMKHTDFGRESFAGNVVWLIFSNFGPALAGVIALALCRGRGAVAELGRSLVRWRVRGWLYAAAWFGLVINGAVVIAGLPAHVLRFDPGAFAPVKFAFLYFVMIALDGPLGEEIGWRGTLLPQLLEKLRPLPAAAMVGVIWYAWHVPLYAAEARMTTLPAHLLFFYTCIALSIIFTWFFLESKGSTLLMIYLHNASNYSTFLRFKLFPKIADSPVIAVTYCTLLFGFALAAGLALCAKKSYASEL